MSDIVAVEELIDRMADSRTLAALDVGTKTIGVAVSDRGLSFASPRPVIRRRKFKDDMAALQKQFDADQVGAVIVGLPVNMDGSEEPRAQSARAVARNIAQASGLPVALWDERLSTVAAERALIDQDVSRRKRAERIDSAAASFILQGALDRLYSAAGET